MRAMSLHLAPNDLTRLLAIETPVLCAPMAGVAGGALAAAVSSAGGFGFIGGGYCDPEWLGAELARAGRARIGVGFIGWRLAQVPEVLSLALAHEPAAVLLSFSDVAPWVEPVRAAGARVIAQVQSVRQARAAADAGAEVIVAQGTEAGGHAGLRATLPLVPAVVDAVAPLPVVAAGGIGDARGVAAAMMLGAQGVMLGSRFYLTQESLAHAALRERAVAASGDDTVRSDVFDRLRGWEWPPGYALRTLANDTTRAGTGPGDDIAPALQQCFDAAVAAGDADVAPVIAGEALDLLNDLPSAAGVVTALAAEAAALLVTAPGLVSDRAQGN